MQTYFVVLVENYIDSDTWEFCCEADNSAHAEEQAQNAYPGAMILQVYQDET